MTISRKLPSSLVNLPASQTDAEVARCNVHYEGRNLRMEFFVGKVVVAAAVSIKVQQSSLYNIWEDTKSVTITASTNTTATAVAATDIITATGHGLASGDPIVFNTTDTLPAPLLPNAVYYAEVLSANTLYARREPSGGVIDLTSAGVGTQTVTKVRSFGVKFLSEVAGDQTYLPLKSTIRAVATTGAGDSLQLLQAISIQAE